MKDLERIYSKSIQSDDLSRMTIRVSGVLLDAVSVYSKDSQSAMTPSQLLQYLTQNEIYNQYKHYFCAVQSEEEPKVNSLRLEELSNFGVDKDLWNQRDIIGVRLRHLDVPKILFDVMEHMGNCCFPKISAQSIYTNIIEKILLKKLEGNVKILLNQKKEQDKINTQQLTM